MSVTSTVYSKLCTQILQSFSRGLDSSCLHVFKTYPNSGNDLKLFKAVEQTLVTGGVLHYEFCTAIYREDKGHLGFPEFSDILFGVSLKISYGADFAQIDHRHLDMEKA